MSEDEWDGLGGGGGGGDDEGDDDDDDDGSELEVGKAG